MAFARVYYPVNESQTLLKAGDLHFQDGKPLLVFKWRRRYLHELVPTRSKSVKLLPVSVVEHDGPPRRRPPRRKH